MKTYLIDNKVVSFFIGEDEDSQKIFEFFASYLIKLQDIFVECLKYYFTNITKWSQGKISEEEKIFRSGDKDELESVLDLEFMDYYQSKINEYGKAVYEMYGPKLDQATKDKLNSYISSQQSQVNEETELQKKILSEVVDKLEEEYNTTGRIRSNEEVIQEKEEELDYLRSDKTI